MPDNNLRIIITTDASGAVTGLRTFENHLKNTTSVAETAMSTLASRIQKNWFAISAAITASAATVYKAWDLMDQAASFADQKANLQSLAAAYGTSADAIIKRTQEVSKGMISMSDIVDTSVNAMTKNLNPMALIELAKYADALGDTMKTSAAEGFKTLAEAAALGRERTLENIVGIIDLNAAFGDQIKRMSDAEKANARMNILLTRLRDIYPDAGSQALSFGDKMEQLKATVKNLELVMGTGLIRAFAGVVGAFYWLAAGALQLYGYLLKLPEALAWLQSKTGVTEKIRAEGKAWLDSIKTEQQAAFEAAGELAVKGVDNFTAMTAGSEELAAAMSKVRTRGEDNKQWLKEIADATAEWKNKIMEMNPALDEWDLKLLKLSEEIKKAELEGKVSKKVLNEAWLAGNAQIALEKEKKALEERNKLREKQLRDDYESYQEEVMITSAQAAEINRIEDDVKAKSIERSQAMRDTRLDAFRDIINAYRNATDLTQEWGESEVQYHKRILEAQEKWRESLVHAQKELEKTGDTGSQAYRDITRALDDLNVAQLGQTSKFTEGWQMGLKQWQDDMNNAYENGRRLSDDAARSFTGAFQEMFFGNFKKGLDIILDYFKRVLAQMIAQAIANPIIIPIVQAMGGVVGGTGTQAGLMGLLQGGNGTGFNFGGMNLGGGLRNFFGLPSPGYAGVGMNGPNMPGILGNGTAYGGSAFGNFVSSAAPYLGMAASGYGLYNAYQQKSPLMGMASGAMMAYSAGAAMSAMGLGASAGTVGGPVGMVIGAVIGAIIGALGKGVQHKKTAISYDPDRASGAWAIRHEEMFPAAAVKQFKDSMEKWRMTLKDFMTAIGGDVSRFDQEWVSGRASLKKKNTVERLFDFFFSSYTEWVTGIDFNAFAKDGEKLADTIASIVSAVMTIETLRNRDVAASAGMNWDIQDLYDSISLQGNTFAESIADLDKQIGNALEGLKDLTGTDYRNQLELLSGLIVQRYQAEVQYLTYIKGLAEGIAQSIAQQIEGFQLDVMSHKQQIDFYNSKVSELFEMLKTATDPQIVEQLVQQIQQYASSGWAVLSDEEKKKSIGNITDFLEEVNRIAQDKLAGAVTSQQAAIDKLVEQLSKIDYAPLGALAKSAQDAADALAAIPVAVGTANVPAHASGLDYVPHDNYVAKLHAGEAVITAQGNTALAALVQKIDALMQSDKPVQVVISGDMAQFLRVSINGTIQTLRANPGLLAR